VDVTESQAGIVLAPELAIVNGVPLAAAEVTLMVCAEAGLIVAGLALLLHVKLSELTEGTSAEPLLVMFRVTGTTRAVPVATPPVV
jgi:hypothetical protein